MNQQVASAIAEALAEGLFHPGDPDDPNKPAKMLKIPMFGVQGRPKPYADAARDMDYTIGEAVVHLIENTLDCSIIGNSDLEELRAERESLQAEVESLQAEAEKLDEEGS